MKVLFLTIWISAVLIQEVVPSTLVRYPRHTSNASSFLHTEYEAKIEQTGKHGNESFGKMSGKQAIEHDNCNDNWNAFANKCAALIKDLVASLASTVSSKPGDATNLQLHIKNTFRHLDNTHNCSCLNHTGKELADMDLSHLFDNLTLSTTGPDSDNDKGHLDKEEHPQMPVVIRPPKKLNSDSNVNPENEEDPNGTSNSRRQAAHEPYHLGTAKPNYIASSPLAQNHHGQKGVFHPFLTTPLPSTECSDSASEAITTTPPLYYAHKQSPLESSSSKKSDGYGYPSAPVSSHQSDSDPTSVPQQESEPMKKTEDIIIPPTTQIQEPVRQSPEPTVEDNSTPTDKTPDLELEKPDQEYEDPSEHEISKKPKQHDSSHMPDSHSYESPDYDSPTEAPVIIPVETSSNNNPPIIPVTNTNSNIPESSEPTTGNDSLSSGTSPSPSDENCQTEDVVTIPAGTTSDCEQTTPSSGTTPFSSDKNSQTEDVVNIPVGTTSDCEQTTTPSCDETNGAETVTIPSKSITESPPTVEVVKEVLITPKPIMVSQIPIENQNVTPQTSENTENRDSETANQESPIIESTTPVPSQEEDCSTTPQAVYPSDEQIVTKVPVEVVLPQNTEQPHSHSTDEPVITQYEPPKNERHTNSQTSSVLPGKEDSSEVSENPIIIQPTTFQTTSEEPTKPPLITQPSLQLIPVTTASTPLDSDEGSTTESKHKHHDHDDDHDDDEDDCCSCESCTEEEDSDPKKVKENVCKSLEEARKELKAIFDKIKKKLRCCRKIPQSITSDPSPLS